MLSIVVSIAPQAQQAGAQEAQTSTPTATPAQQAGVEVTPESTSTNVAPSEPQLIRVGSETVLTVQMEARQVSSSCWEYTWDGTAGPFGTWDLIQWGGAPTGGYALADWYADGATFLPWASEDPALGSPTKATYSWYAFAFDPLGSGAQLQIEPTRNGASAGFYWFIRSENLSPTPVYAQVEFPDFSVNGAFIRSNGAGRKLGWDYFRIFKCYDGVPLTATPTSTPRPTITPRPTNTFVPTATPTRTFTPTPTRTPMPTPTVTPTVADDTLWLATPAPVVQVDTEGDVCRIASLPIAGGTGQARVSEAPDSWPNSNPQLPALRECFSPSQAAWIPPGQCLNPTRILVGKNTPDGTMAFSIVFQCNSQGGGALMMTSTSAGTNPIIGPVVGFVALSMMAISASPHNIEVFWEPAGNAIAEGGRFIATNVEEAKDVLLGLAVKPTTLYLGQPAVYAQIFDGKDIAGIFRGYRTATNWEETVWSYPASAGVDANTVASLQYFTEGSRGAVLKTVIFKTTPNGGAGYPLWDANVQMFLDGYPANPLYPGLPPRTGEHSDKTPAESARKRFGYNWYMNQNYEYRQAGIRPPHKWCGIRSDGTCSCVDYTMQVIRWVVNGVGKVKIKIYEGVALVWNPENPSVLMGLTQSVQGAAPFSDGARPLGRQWLDYRTVDLNNPSDLDQCPDHFGLRFAGRATDQGIPASMLPEGGEIQ